METESKTYESGLKRLLYGSRIPKEQTIFNPIDPRFGTKVMLQPRRRRWLGAVEKVMNKVWQEDDEDQEKNKIERRK